MNLEKILYELPAGVAILDEHMRLILVNKRITDKSGVTTEITDPLQTVHPEDREKAIDLIKKVREERYNEVPYPVLLRVVKKDGYQWNEIRWKVIEDNGKIFYVLVFTDVTERVILQKRIEDLLEYVRFLINIMGHDIMNILATIHSYAEIAEENQSFRFIEKIKEAVLKGRDLIVKIRELESSTRENTKVFSLRKVIEESAKSYEIEVSIRGDALVYANEGIYNVFDNLISNSLKHGRAKRIDVEIQTSDRTYVIFKDDGIGIPEELSEKIFEKGFSTSGGTGMGLFIVKKLLESYGGDIKLEKSEKGAQFLISFQLITEPQTSKLS